MPPSNRWCFDAFSECELDSKESFVPIPAWSELLLCPTILNAKRSDLSASVPLVKILQAFHMPSGLWTNGCHLPTLPQE